MSNSIFKGLFSKSWHAIDELIGLAISARSTSSFISVFHASLAFDKALNKCSFVCWSHSVWTGSFLYLLHNWHPLSLLSEWNKNIVFNFSTKTMEWKWIFFKIIRANLLKVWVFMSWPHVIRRPGGTITWNKKLRANNYKRLVGSSSLSLTNSPSFSRKRCVAGVLCPRSWKAYADVECHERCVVRIVKIYIWQCPKGSLDINAFYLKSLQKYESKNVWFSTVPLGHNKLNSMVKTMAWLKLELRDILLITLCEQQRRSVEINGSKRCRRQVKLIRGVTAWHRSEALHGYKREINEQLLKVSKISSVRPVQWNNNQYGAGP